MRNTLLILLCPLAAILAKSMQFLHNFYLKSYIYTNKVLPYFSNSKNDLLWKGVNLENIKIRISKSSCGKKQKFIEKLSKSVLNIKKKIEN